jgi:hypothetical protein
MPTFSRLLAAVAGPHLILELHHLEDRAAEPEVIAHLLEHLEVEHQQNQH